MESSNKECRLNLAVQTIQQDSKLSIRAAAELYMVDRSAIGKRLQGITARRDTMPHLRKLTDLEAVK